MDLVHLSVSNAYNSGAVKQRSVVLQRLVVRRFDFPTPCLAARHGSSRTLPRRRFAAIKPTRRGFFAAMEEHGREASETVRSPRDVCLYVTFTPSAEKIENENKWLCSFLSSSELLRCLLEDTWPVRKSYYEQSPEIHFWCMDTI